MIGTDQRNRWRKREGKIDVKFSKGLVDFSHPDPAMTMTDFGQSVRHIGQAV